MIWKGLGVVTNTDSPIVVVLSESMEPAFARGDLLFLTLESSPIAIGEIVVFKIKGKDIPIVHRVLEIHKDEKGKEFILTKGDNNAVDDRGLYNQGQMWIHVDEIIGRYFSLKSRVKGQVPYVGMITILLNDYPKLKYLLLGGMAIAVLSNREDQ